LPIRPPWQSITPRCSRSRAEALAYIREQAGKQFDPRVVQAFLELVEENSLAQENGSAP